MDTSIIKLETTIALISNPITEQWEGINLCQFLSSLTIGQIGHLLSTVNFMLEDTLLYRDDYYYDELIHYKILSTLSLFIKKCKKSNSKTINSWDRIIEIHTRYHFNTDTGSNCNMYIRVLYAKCINQYVILYRTEYATKLKYLLHAMGPDDKPHYKHKLIFI